MIYNIDKEFVNNYKVQEFIKKGNRYGLEFTYIVQENIGCFITNDDFKINTLYFNKEETNIMFSYVDAVKSKDLLLNKVVFDIYLYVLKKYNYEVKFKVFEDNGLTHIYFKIFNNLKNQEILEINKDINERLNKFYNKKGLAF